MKTIKKLLALTLALVICATCALPALAASITLDGAKTNGHTYDVYQIFTGDVSGSTLSNVKLGTAISPFTFEGKEYKTGDSVPNEVLDKLNGLGAEVLAKNLKKGVYGDLKERYGQLTEPAYSLTDVPTGYYLIVDNGTTEYSSISAYMLQLLGDVTIEPKNTTPTVDKTIGDDQTEAIENIGDTVPFTLTATLPLENLSKYTTYKMVFEDTMSKGLTFNPDSVQYKITVGTEVIPEGAPVKVPAGESGNICYGTDNVAAPAEGVQPDAYTGGTALTVNIPDLFALMQKPAEDAQGTVTVTVTYTATLNNDAVIGVESNPNKVKLVYSNDPNNSDEGETPEEEVKVYSFKLDGHKVDGNGDDLHNAKFQLYRGDEDEPSSAALTLYLKGNEYYAAPGDDWAEGTYTTTDVIDAEYNVNEATTGFSVKGLTEGTYWLKETGTPDGYNTCAPIKVVITATRENGKPTGAYTYTIYQNGEKKDEGKNLVTIVNEKGSTLPSTGGIGTTIFYIVGAVLVIGAGVLLFTKQRMGSKS